MDMHVARDASATIDSMTRKIAKPKADVDVGTKIRDQQVSQPDSPPKVLYHPVEFDSSTAEATARTASLVCVDRIIFTLEHGVQFVVHSTAADSMASSRHKPFNSPRQVYICILLEKYLIIK